MRSLQLQAALSEFVEAAAGHLRAAVEAGAEVPYEVGQQGRRRRGPTLYCYQPLTGEFIRERQDELERLPSYARAASLLTDFEGLDRYLASIEVDVGPRARHVGVRAAIRSLLSEVFAGQSDFDVRPERLSAALERLEHSTLAATSELTLVATLHGLTITSPELTLAKGLAIAQPSALNGLPLDAVADGEHECGHLVVVLNADDEDPRRALEHGRTLLGELLRALRLFGDGRVTLGSLAWARVGEGSWNALAMGAEGKPRGLLVVTAEQEDELRAFCNLVSRRAPHGNELAWALRRFELGCERPSCHEALSDHLLALRALLEPEGSASGRLPRRLAALCATPEQRPELSARAEQAIALERAVIAGTAVEHAGAQELAKDMADHLRALLRDVICGHLDPDLVSFADQLLAEADAEADAEAGAEAAVEPEPELVAEASSARSFFNALVMGRSSGEEVLGDVGESAEILDVFI
jgi:hypothetical protein